MQKLFVKMQMSHTFRQTHSRSNGHRREIYLHAFRKTEHKIDVKRAQINLQQVSKGNY